MINCALLKLRGYNDAITRFNTCTLLKYTHPGTHTHYWPYALTHTQRDIHTSIHTNPTQIHIERAHNHLKYKNTGATYHAHSQIHANIHSNTHIHHMHLSTLVHKSKRTENNNMRSYTITQPDCHTDACLHANTRTHSITYMCAHTLIHTQA